MSAKTGSPDAIPLSLFLPDDLPLDDLSSLFMEKFNALETPNDVSVAQARAFKTATALGEVVHGQMNVYDEACGSFTDGIKGNKGHCLTRTALAGAIGQKITTGRVVPVIQVSRYDNGEGKYVHGLFMVPAGQGKFVTADCMKDDYAYGTVTPRNPQFGSKALPPLRSGSKQPSIIQVRTMSGAGKLKTRVLVGRATQTERHPVENHESFTYFFGLEGLKSFLSAAEHISAKTQGREPELFDAQLRPRV